MQILCLGDSITDCGRLMEHPPLGNGYVNLLVQQTAGQNPDRVFINRGFDGFTVERLLQTAPEHDTARSADVITILIGINDIGLMMNTDRTPAQQEQMMRQFFTHYEELLLRLSHPACAKRKTPQIILMEPFIFPYPEKYRRWIPFVKQMSRGIGKLAGQYNLPYVLLQEDLYHAGETHGWDFITTDGIHLTLSGHRLLARKLSGLLMNFTVPGTAATDAPDHEPPADVPGK